MVTPIVDTLKKHHRMTMHSHTEADLGVTLDNRYVNVSGDTMTGKLNPSGGMNSPYTNVVVVDSGGKGDYTTVQAAINAVSPISSSPVKVQINAGTYTETITPKSYMSFVGAGKGITILKNGTNDTCHIDCTGLTDVTFQDLSLDPIKFSPLFPVTSFLKFTATTYIVNCKYITGGGSNVARADGGIWVNCEIENTSTNFIAGGAGATQGKFLSCLFLGNIGETDFLIQGTYLPSSVFSRTYYSAGYPTVNNSYISGTATIFAPTYFNQSYIVTTSPISNTPLYVRNSRINTLNIPSGYGDGDYTITVDLFGGNVGTLAFPVGSLDADKIRLYGTVIDAVSGTVSGLTIKPDYAPKYFLSPAAAYTPLLVASAGSASVPTSIFKAGSSQIGNLTEWQNPSGTALSCVDESGNVGIGTANPTAYLHLKAGTATASTAPLKLTKGTLLGTVEDGALEFDGDYFYSTSGQMTGVNHRRRVVSDDRVVSFNDEPVFYEDNLVLL